MSTIFRSVIENGVHFPTGEIPTTVSLYTKVASEIYRELYL